MKNHAVFALALSAASSVVSYAQTNQASVAASSVVDCSTVLARQRAPEACAKQDQSNVKSGKTTSIIGKGVPTAPQFTVQGTAEKTDKTGLNAAAKK
jgi:hypothetical protein